MDVGGHCQLRITTVRVTGCFGEETAMGFVPRVRGRQPERAGVHLESQGGTGGWMLAALGRSAPSHLTHSMGPECIPHRCCEEKKIHPGSMSPVQC